MEDVRIIEVKRSVFADNDADAERLRQQLQQEKTFLLNLMSSPVCAASRSSSRSAAMWR